MYRFTLTGEVASPTLLPSGCFLCGRCPLELPECSKAPMPLKVVAPHHEVACLLDLTGSA